MKFELEQECQFVISILKDLPRNEHVWIVKVGMEKIGTVSNPHRDPYTGWQFFHYKSKTSRTAFKDKIYAALTLAALHINYND